MKLIIEFEAEALQGRDIVNPLADLAREGATSSLEVENLDAGSVSGLTPDGRELRIDWRVESSTPKIPATHESYGDNHEG